MTIAEIREKVNACKVHSTWDRGVLIYANELLDEIAENIEHGYYHEDDIEAPKMLDEMMLNGARDWDQYSYGGCSLVYDGDIAERLCTPSELKKTRNGELQPNMRETWLDVQARALYQAARKIRNAAAACEQKILP